MQETQQIAIHECVNCESFARLKDTVYMDWLDEEGGWNKKKAAKYLGIEESTLSAWITQGRAPRYAKLGRRVLFKREWLDDYLEENSVRH